MSNEPDQVEPIRRALRTSVIRLTDAGRLAPTDAALGALYATHDLAMHTGIGAHDAIEWMRTAADLMERQLLARDAAAHG